jgi:alkylation response protein AidB-like acyl-CoA dehydrogenase
MGHLPGAEQEELVANVHQIVGGIGVTAEHDAHRYHRRQAERLLPASGGTP